MKYNSLDYNKQADNYKLLRPDFRFSIRHYSVTYFDLWNGSMLQYDTLRGLLKDFNKLKGSDSKSIRNTAYQNGYMFYLIRSTNSILVFHYRNEFGKVMATFERLTGRNMSYFKNYLF